MESINEAPLPAGVAAGEGATSAARAKCRVLDDPAALFDGWRYAVSANQWLAFGVFPRFVIDTEKTKLARERAIADGLPQAEATRRVKVMRREVVINTPPVYAFQVGDLFFGADNWWQVMGGTEPGVDQVVEVHCLEAGERIGYRIPAADFVLCLKTGNRPEHRFRITRSERSSIQLSSIGFE